MLVSFQYRVLGVLLIVISCVSNVYAKINSNVSPDTQATVNSNRLENSERVLAYHSDQVAKQYSNLAVPFIKNEGQLDEAVAYYANLTGVETFVTKAGRIVYKVHLEQKNNISNNLSAWVLDEQFVGSRKINASGLSRAKHNINYFNDIKSKSTLSVDSFDRVSLGKVWQGIHVYLEAKGNFVEKYFIVNPGANPGNIKVKVSGTDKLSLNKIGELKAKAGFKEVTFSSPVAYQERHGKRHYVDIAYVVKGNTYSFELGEYDKTIPVTIDPILQATYLGGSQNDAGPVIAFSENYGVYVAGRTWSPDLPSRLGAYDSTYASQGDIFVSRLSRDLQTIVQTTYFGGGGTEQDVSIAINQTSGDVYIAGMTDGSLPGTTNGAQDTYAGGVGAFKGDLFVARLSADLQTLLQATYYGGSGSEIYATIAIHPGSENVYLSGRTASSDLLGMAGGYQTTRGSGLAAFVAMLNPGLTQILQATYFGRMTDLGAPFLALHPSNGVYLAGVTNVIAIPGTVGGAVSSYSGGNDLWVSLLSTDLTALVQSTYYGGTQEDAWPSLAIDTTDGSVYLAGVTQSNTLPGVTPDAPVSGKHLTWGSFVAKFNGGLTTLEDATYISSTYSEFRPSIAVHPTGRDVYMAGQTNITFLVSRTGGVMENINNSSSIDTFISHISSDLDTVYQSTYFGSSSSDYSGMLVIDTLDDGVYVSGKTDGQSLAANTAVGGAQENNAGNDDIFIAKFDHTLEADITPDAFTFVDRTDIGLGVTISSNIITVTGIDAFAPISVVGGQYSIDGGSYQSNAGQISRGQTVRLSATAPNALSATTDVVLTIGTLSDTFSVSTYLIDTEPEFFLLAGEEDVPPGTIATTQFTVNGINSPASITIDGEGQYSINGGVMTSEGGTVLNNQEVTIQLVSSETPDETVETTLTIGTTEFTFSVTTASASVDSGGSSGGSPGITTAGGSSGGGGGGGAIGLWFFVVYLMVLFSCRAKRVMRVKK